MAYLLPNLRIPISIGKESVCLIDMVHELNRRPEKILLNLLILEEW